MSKRRFIVVLTLLLFVSFSFPAQGNNSSAEMNRAVTLSIKGKDKEAQKIIEAIIKKGPKNK